MANRQDANTDRTTPLDTTASRTRRIWFFVEHSLRLTVLRGKSLTKKPSSHWIYAVLVGVWLAREEALKIDKKTRPIR